MSRSQSRGEGSARLSGRRRDLRLIPLAYPVLAVSLLPALALSLSKHAVAMTIGYLAAALAITLIVLLTRAYHRTVATLEASEVALTRRLRLEDVITRASTRFINVDLAQVDMEIDRALCELGEFAGADRAYVFQFRADEEVMDNTHEWCREGVAPAIDQLQGQPFSAFPWFMEHMIRREVFLVPRVRDLPAEARLEREEFGRERIESLICVPMALEERAVGFIGFDSVTAEDAWSEEAVTLLRVAASAISGALARRRGEEAQRASEERYRDLVEGTSDWIWEVDANGVYIYTSPKVQELLGYEPSEVVGRTPFDLMSPEEARRVSEVIRPYFERCEPFVHLENRNLHKDGHEVVLDTSGVPILDGEGKLCGFRGIDRDVSEQKLAREALQKSEERYRQFLQISAEGIWRLEASPPIPTDQEEHVQAELMLQRARVMECNAVFATRNGFARPEEMIGLSLDDLWQLEHDVKLAVLVGFIRSGYRITDLESSAPLPDGTLGYFLDNFVGVVEGDFLVGAWGTERDITHRRRAEEALRESEARYRRFLQMSVEGIWRLEAVPPIPLSLTEREQAELMLERGRVAEANDTIARRYGFAGPEEMVGAQLRDLWVEAHETRIEMLLQFVRSGYRIADLETTGQLLDGSKGWFLHNLVGIIDDGHITGAWGTMRDITHRRRTEEALRRERDLVDRIMETSPIGITAVNRAGEITFANAGAERVLGLTKDETTGLTYNDPRWRITDHAGQPISDEEMPFRKVQATGQAVYDVRHAIEHPDGRRVLLSINAAPVFTEEGEFDGMVAAIEDVTEMLRAEEELRRSEERFRAIVESTRDWIWRVDVNGVHRYSNRAVSSLLGYAPEEIVGKPAMAFMHPEDLPRATMQMEQAVRERRGWSALTIRWRHKNGTYRYLESASAPAFTPAGELLGWYGADRDVTERMQMQEALERSEARLRALFAAMTDVILVMGADGRYLEIVPTKPDLLFRPAEELLGRTVEEVFPAEQAEFFHDRIREALEKKEPVSMSYTLLIGERELRFAAEVSPLSEDTVIVVARDITVQTEQYEQWLAAERARATLAEHLNEEINHRARNNLAMVSGLLQMQALQTTDTGLAEKLREAVARIRTFVDIHEKIYAAGAERVDLLEVLQQVAATLSGLFAGLGAEVSVEGVSTPCPTRAATNLAVVTNELITNALKHGRPEPEGALRIEVRVARADGRLELSVWNSGNPVPEDFDAWAQAGMGLRLACDLVAQYSGTCALRPVAGGTLAELVIEEAALRE